MKRTNFPIISTALLLVILAPVGNAQFPMLYNASDWMSQYYSGPYHSDPAPSLSYYSESVALGIEPGLGYPMKSGLQFGLSDTVLLRVVLTNGTLSPITISGTPSQWFTPVLFDFEADPHVVYPFADSSDLGWKFIGWQAYSSWNNITQPATIASGTQYVLVYFVWGFPAGQSRLQVRKTASAPSTLVNLIGFGGDIWVTKPQDRADTINAFAACYWREHDINASQANQIRWVDSMFVRNSKSLPAYELKSSNCSEFNDSLGYLAALDSTLAIATSYRDTLMDDTAKFTGWHRAWYQQVIEMANWQRDRLLSGNWKSYID